MKEKNPSSKNLRNFGNKNTIKSVFPLDLLIISYFILLYPTEYFWIALWCQLKRREYQTTLPVSWEICMQVRKQQLEPDMEKWTGSKLGREYVKAVYCHPAYLTSLQSRLCEMPGWMKHKLKSRLLGEISITSDMQMMPPLWQKAKRN